MPHTTPGSSHVLRKWWPAGGSAQAEAGWDEQGGQQLHGNPGASVLWYRQMLCWVGKWKSSLEDNKLQLHVSCFKRVGSKLEGGLERHHVNWLMPRKYSSWGKLNKLGLFSIKSWKWVVWSYLCSKEANTLTSVYLIEKSWILSRKIAIGC